MKFRIAKFVIALAIACVSCGYYAADRLVNRARHAATADQWRAWAAQVIQRDATNSTPLPISEWPDFVRRTATSDRTWQVAVNPPDENSGAPKLVMLVALGGFQSIGLIIGPPSYVEAPRPTQKSKRVYPGIYVREVG